MEVKHEMFALVRKAVINQITPRAEAYGMQILLVSFIQFDILWAKLRVHSVNRGFSHFWHWAALWRVIAKAQ